MPDHKITQVMMDDNTIDASKEIKMVLSIANTLRGPYRAENYKDVIIPMIILRRLECALAKTKKAVVAAYKKNPKAPAQLLCKKSGYQFYNKSLDRSSSYCGESDFLYRFVLAECAGHI